MCNNGTYTLAVTNSCLMGLKIYSTKGKPQLVLKTSQLPRVTEHEYSEETPTTTNLLNQHIPQLHAKHHFPYTHKQE